MEINQKDFPRKIRQKKCAEREAERYRTVKKKEVTRTARRDWHRLELLTFLEEVSAAGGAHHRRCGRAHPFSFLSFRSFFLSFARRVAAQRTTAPP